jgi:hypothetical protein
MGVNLVTGVRNLMSGSGLSILLILSGFWPQWRSP